jgi:hypothetical protein
MLLMDVAKRSEYIWSHRVDNFLHAAARIVAAIRAAGCRRRECSKEIFET